MYYHLTAVSFGKKRLAFFESYGTITTPWDGIKTLLRSESNQPDPCFWPMLEAGHEITGKGRKSPASGGCSKTGSEKPLENQVNATRGKVNPEWSWMCRKSKFGGESCLFGWPIARPHFWPIRDHHAVDWADFNGFMTSGFSVKKGKKP